MKITLNGSRSSDAAIRAAALTDQLNEALWRAAGEIPSGSATVTVVSSETVVPGRENCTKTVACPYPDCRRLGTCGKEDRRSVVYLCGGINGLSDADAKGWREEAARRLWPRFDVRDPMSRDYRGREADNVQAIVDGDLADIQASDILLVNASRPSWGTAMELYAAHSWGRYVVAFGAGDRPSPWLVHHAHFLAPDLAAALAHLQERGG